MGKSNGRIQDWVKGGSGLRVTNGAAHVRIMGGGGGGSVTFPITPAQGGTGTTTVFTVGSVVFVGPAGVYTEDNANFFWNNTTKRLIIGGNTDETSITARLQVIGVQRVLGSLATFVCDDRSTGSADAFAFYVSSGLFQFFSYRGLQNVFSIDSNGNIVILGTYNGSPSVTGSRAGNAALASLLTKLATSKIIVDNTSA
jgi:hypothetical protein